MGSKDFPLLVVLVCVQAFLACAGPPDWVPPEVIEMVQEDKERCMGEHGTTQAQIDEVNEGKLMNNPSITCYMYCLLEAFSLADEEGDIDTDMLLSLLPENLQDKAVAVTKKCTPSTGADKCEKIFNVAKCVHGEVPDMWFVV